MARWPKLPTPGSRVRRSQSDFAVQTLPRDARCGPPESCASAIGAGREKRLDQLRAAAYEAREALPEELI
jgi:hypothetical protein